MRFGRSLSPLLFVHAAAFAAALLPGLAQAKSGTTLTPDGLAFMVSKDVGADRWTINLNLSSTQPEVFLNATGNVFHSDGSAPSFLYCSLRSESAGTLTVPTSEFLFSCSGADACNSTPQDCAQNSWQPIAEVSLAASFFLPEAGLGQAQAATRAAVGTRRLVIRPAAARALARGAVQASSNKGATLSPDLLEYLVNKDVGPDRWSISVNLLPMGGGSPVLHSVTGNVYKPDGSPPSFIYCTVRPDSTGSLADPTSTFRFACSGTETCTSTALGCAGSAWQAIADDVQLPASFFLPPSPVVTPTPQPTLTPEPSDTPTPEPTPTPTPGCQSSFGEACNVGLGASACCIPSMPGIPCQTNESSPSQAICTDVEGPSVCQPQTGSPCQIGGYNGCCSDQLACVDHTCQAP